MSDWSILDAARDEHRDAERHDTTTYRRISGVPRPIDDLPKEDEL